MAAATATVATAAQLEQAYSAECRKLKVKPNSTLVAQLKEQGAGTIAALDLSANYCGTVNGFNAVMVILRQGNQGLQTVDLSDCHLTADNVRDLCDLLIKTQAPVHTLVLHRNRLYIDAGNALARLARFNAHVVQVLVRDDPEDAEGPRGHTANHVPERIVRRIEFQCKLNRQALRKALESKAAAAA